MTRKTQRITTLAFALALAGSAGALAAGPLNGKTYQGRVPSTGINERHHRQKLHAGGNISLRVSGNGRSVTVRFSSSSPVLYCNTQLRLHSQSTKPAAISGGSFKATIGQKFTAGPGSSAIVQVITGHFSGRTVKGAIHTHAPVCGGTATYSATAR